MKKCLIIVLVVFAVAASNPTHRLKLCIENIKHTAYYLDNLRDSYYMDKKYPDLYYLKFALKSGSRALKNCIGVTYDFSKYDTCVDEFAPFFVYLDQYRDAWDFHDLENLLLSLRSMYLLIHDTVIQCLESLRQNQTTLAELI